MVENVTPFEALQLAVERLGSLAKVAELCEVSTTAVWKWVQSGKRLPGEFVLRVEAATGVSRNWLRPDLYPLGLVDGVPYDAEEPNLPVFMPVVPSNRVNGFDGRDRRANGVDRFYGAARQ